MPFKINIGHKGKSWKIEIQDDSLAGKEVGNTIKGEEVKPELSGYELQITGGSDTSGFPLSKDVEGIALRKVLLTKGWGMWERGPKGLRRRKTVRGKSISGTTSQINMKVTKEGSKSLAEVFPDQNKAEAPKEEAKPAESPAQ